MATTDTGWWQGVYATSGGLDEPMAEHTRCAYCARTQAMPDDGRCQGCGAPLPIADVRAAVQAWRRRRRSA